MPTIIWKCKHMLKKAIEKLGKYSEIKLGKWQSINLNRTNDTTPTNMLARMATSKTQIHEQELNTTLRDHWNQFSMTVHKWQNMAREFDDFLVSVGLIIGQLMV